MEPVSKDGSSIRPEIFRKLQTIGRQLEVHGYVERGRRPNLFVRDYRGVKFYADFGGTDDVPIWRDPRPLFYWFWHPKPGPAPEIRQRMVLVEWVRLGDVPRRLSYDLMHDQTETRVDAQLVEQFDYEARRALFVGPHATWADERFASELGHAAPDQNALLDEATLRRTQDLK